MSTEFQWNDTTVKEFVTNLLQTGYYDIPKHLADFKASKQPKPEWEILSYEHGVQSQYIIYPNDLNWNNAVLHNWPIHSVKRLSDGEVFTLGDKIEFHTASEYLPIERFETSPFDKKLMSAWNGPYGKGIQECKKQEKQIMLTTDDGIALYKGDKFWHVSLDFEVSGNVANAIWTSPVRCFSTKEKAEEYVVINKPCLSVVDAYGTWHSSPERFKEKLIEKAKDKLNEV